MTPVHNTFLRYQAATADTAIYPEAGTGSQIALAYVGLGLGEAGEIQGKLKKVIRDDEGVVSPDTRDALIAEMGDLLWYIARLCDELGVPISMVADNNLQKLVSRQVRGVLGGSGDNR